MGLAGHVGQTTGETIGDAEKLPDAMRGGSLECSLETTVLATTGIGDQTRRAELVTSPEEDAIELLTSPGDGKWGELVMSPGDGTWSELVTSDPERDGKWAELVTCMEGDGM